MLKENKQGGRSRLQVPKGRRRGKSGLHRAGCRITSGGGDSQASATEIYRETADASPLPQGWKGSVRDYRLRGNTESHVNPIRSKTEQRAMSLPGSLSGGSLEAAGDGGPR